MSVKAFYLAGIGVIYIMMLICGIRLGKRKSSLAKILVSLLCVGAAMMLFNMAFFVFSKVNRAGLFHLGLYYALCDWLVIGLLMYAQEYTRQHYFRNYIFVFLGVFAIFDFVSLMLNVKFNHMFSIRVSGFPTGEHFFQAYNYTIVLYIHLAYVYMVAVSAALLVLKKACESVKYYRGKYITVFLFFVMVIALNAMVFFSRAPVDVSAFCYIALAIMTSYHSVFSVENKLVTKTLQHIDKKLDEAIVCFDTENHCIYINDMGRRLFNIDPSEKDFSSLTTYFLTWKFKNRDAELDGFTWSDTQIIDDQQKYFQAEYHEIWEHKTMLASYFTVSDKTASLEQLQKERKLSDYDHLTGLYNREKFFKTLKDVIAAQPDVERVIVCSNINDFKLINEIFGSARGDEILVAESNLMKKMSRSGSVAGRISGDKFALCLPKVRYTEESFLYAIDRLSEMLDDSGFKLHISVGVYTIPLGDTNVEDFVDKALVACSEAGNNYNKIFAYYSDDMLFQSVKKMHILSDYDDALRNGQFKMYLQPQISSTTGNLTGAEALVRWIHPERGIISPGEFIPVLENSGLIYKLDSLMWEEAVKQLKRWEEDGITDIPISVNISTKDLFCMDVYKTLTGLIKNYNLDPKRLNLEITESAFMQKKEYAMGIIKQLKEFGFLIEMDDFGSGYSSLNMLKDMNADVVKLDMLFLSDTDNIKKSEQIIKTVIALSKELDMKVIVEGVERSEQTEFLTSAGADIFQGFYFDKPLTLHDFEKKYFRN